MDDRAFWLIVRGALLNVVRAIEKRWGFPEYRHDGAKRGE